MARRLIAQPRRRRLRWFWAILNSHPNVWWSVIGLGTLIFVNMFLLNWTGRLEINLRRLGKVEQDFLVS